MRGGVYPCPDFLAPFFGQVTVLKIIIIKITKIIIINIIETIIIIIKKVSVIRAKRPFCRPKNRTKLPQLGSGGGLGYSGNARKKTFFSIDVFPYTVFQDDAGLKDKDKILQTL